MNIDITRQQRPLSVQEITNRLRPIVAKALRIPEVELSEDTTLIDYGISSLMTIVLIQKINRAFGIQSIQEEMPISHSLTSLSQLISEKLNASHIDSFVS